jgi:hypothetical protein
VPPSCCANWNGPAEHVEAMQAWRIAKLKREEEEAHDALAEPQD